MPFGSIFRVLYNKGLHHLPTEFCLPEFSLLSFFFFSSSVAPSALRQTEVEVEVCL